MKEALIEIFWIAIVALCFAVMIGCIRRMIRNEKVYKLRRYVADLETDYLARTGEWKGFYDKLPSYTKMLSGNEPIRLESYFTKEEIEELLNIKFYDPRHL